MPRKVLCRRNKIRNGDLHNIIVWMIIIRKSVYCIIHCRVDGRRITVPEVLIFNKYVQLVLLPDWRRFSCFSWSLYVPCSEKNKKWVQSTDKGHAVWNKNLFLTNLCLKPPESVLHACQDGDWPASTAPESMCDTASELDGAGASVSISTRGGQPLSSSLSWCAVTLAVFTKLTFKILRYTLL